MNTLLGKQTLQATIPDYYGLCISQIKVGIKMSMDVQIVYIYSYMFVHNYVCSHIAIGGNEQIHALNHPLLVGIGSHRLCQPYAP